MNSGTFFIWTHITISLDNKERPGDVLETKETIKDTEILSIFLFEVNNIVKISLHSVRIRFRNRI